MRNLFLGCLILFLSSCTSHSLDKATAFKMIQEKTGYPMEIGDLLNTVDPVQANIARNSDLVANGLLDVIPSGERIPKGRNIIALTEKGKAYLMPPKENQEPYEQRVRLARAELKSDILLQIGKEGNTAVATYSIIYKDITPFAQMVPQRDFHKERKDRAYFARDEDGWQIVDKPGVEFYEFGY